jgi:alkylhydroperoxidase/carboxymuconolactone decarboxylase family protein YurZ
MKQTDEKKIKEAKKELADLAEKRGGSVLSFHKRIANDPGLVKAFSDSYENSKSSLEHLSPKMIELILFALGCSKGVPTTIQTHGKLAYEKGATVDELGEVMRLVFFYCGAASLIPAAEIFEELDA